MKTKNIKHYIDLGMKSIAYLAEMIVRGAASYVLLTQFDQTIIIGIGLYLGATSALLLVGIVIKASKNAIDFS